MYDSLRSSAMHPETNETGLPHLNGWERKHDLLLHAASATVVMFHGMEGTRTKTTCVVGLFKCRWRGVWKKWREKSWVVWKKMRRRNSRITTCHALRTVDVTVPQDWWLTNWRSPSNFAKKIPHPSPWILHGVAEREAHQSLLVSLIEQIEVRYAPQPPISRQENIMLVIFVWILLEATFLLWFVIIVFFASDMMLMCCCLPHIISCLYPTGSTKKYSKSSWPKRYVSSSARRILWIFCRRIHCGFLALL